MAVRRKKPAAKTKARKSPSRSKGRKKSGGKMRGRGKAMIWPLPLFLGADRQVSTSGCDLQAGINVARAAAFRQVTGDVLEITIFLALRAGLRGLGRRHGVAASGALPVGLPFHGANPRISLVWGV